MSDRWRSESLPPKLRAAVAVGREQEMSQGRRKHSPAFKAKLESTEGKRRLQSGADEGPGIGLAGA